VIGYMRKLIRENRALRRQNVELTEVLQETSRALRRSTARNVELARELRESTRAIRTLLG